MRNQRGLPRWFRFFLSCYVDPVKALRNGLALLVLFFPGVAHVSGSSEVTAQSAYYRAQLQSPRIQFVDESDSASWHARWEAENRARMDKIKAALDAHLPRTGVGWKLVKFDDQLQELWGTDAETPPENFHPERPCRYSFYSGGLIMTVCFQRLPPQSARDELKKQVAALVKAALE